MRLERSTETGSDIPTSTMADIAFLLIIFFMVTSVFSATKGLDLRLPMEDERQARPEPEPAVLVHVERDRIVVDCRPMDLDAIIPYLEPKLLRNPDKPVILHVDSDAEYREMVAVYDVLAGTRGENDDSSFAVRNISIPTRRDIEEYRETFGVDLFASRCAR